MHQIKIAVYALFIMFVASCQKDNQEETLNVSKSKSELIQYNDWTEEERQFFSLSEDEIIGLRDKDGKSGNSVYTPNYHSSLINGINYIASENQRSPFISSITSKVGYPIWSRSFISINRTKGTEFVAIPFAFAQENKTTAIFALIKKNGDYVLDGFAREHIKKDVKTCINTSFAKQLIISDNENFGYQDEELITGYCKCAEPVVPGLTVSEAPVCEWIPVKLCADQETQIGFIGITFPPHLDHDSDGVPNYADADWSKWSWDHRVSQEDLEQYWQNYWESNLEDEYGDYDQFWDDYDQGWDDYESSGAFFDDIWDDIQNGWDQGWDWFFDDDRDGNGIKDIYDDCDNIWDPLIDNSGNISSRTARCEWYYVKDCNNDINGDLSSWWDNVFDEIIPCPLCNDDQQLEEENRLRAYFLEQFIGLHQITSPDYITYLNEVVEGCPALVGQDVFNACLIESVVASFLSEHPTIALMSSNFLADHPNNPEALEHHNAMIINMIIDSEFLALVEASFSFSGIMWSISKEIIADKAVDILAGIVGADEVRDAIKALNNRDWFEFSYEVTQLVLNNTPIGKALKIIDAGSDIYKIAKKLEKIWSKIEGFADDILEQMWDIVSKYGDDIRTNSDLILGIAKTIKRGLKSVDDMVAHAGVPFINNNTVRHILRGDRFNSGRHHISAVVSDQSVQITHIVDRGGGFYTASLRKAGNPPLTMNDKSFFPDSWSEFDVIDAIKGAHINKVPIPNKPGKFIGTYNGVDIEIWIDNDIISTAFPKF